MVPDIFNHEIKVSASVDELEGLIEWIDAILEAEDCTIKAHSQMAIILEEIFVNISRYAYPSEGEVFIRVGIEGPRLILQFEDSGKPFNPLAYLSLDTKARIEERKIGGMGIYIVRKMVDEISYARVDDKNLLTLYKTIRAA
ncbi:MAG: ATP-binding protein [Treponema sp.]|jgi:anti-sigma regulatory factor (Ser/Thr protein kinase)|nr:ATP-binding protein [Treponema sp.]